MSVNNGEESGMARSFEISEESEKLNEEAVILEAEENNNWFYIVGIIILFLVIVGLLIYIRKLKRNKE